MSSYLKYLDKYEEQDNDVIFYLKDYPSSKISGNKIVRELYIDLFHDESLQLNRVHKIEPLTYKIEKEQVYVCVHCSEPIFFDDEYEKVQCGRCSWINVLAECPPEDFSPITVKRKSISDIAFQVCYPEITEKDITRIPEKLQIAVKTYFQDHENFTKEMRDNIYHNLFRKDPEKFERIARKYAQKAKLSKFFKNTNF